MFGLYFSGGRVYQVGSEITEGSNSGVKLPGVTFLQHDFNLVEGVIFAFSAFMRTDAAVHFQLWRPVSAGTDQMFTLVADYPVIPSVIGKREDVSTTLTGFFSVPI